MNIFHSSKDFFGKFHSDFSKKNQYRGSDFFEKISPSNFKNSPANNFGVRARLRTPVLVVSDIIIQIILFKFYSSHHLPTCQSWGCWPLHLRGLDLGWKNCLPCWTLCGGRHYPTFESMILSPIRSSQVKYFRQSFPFWVRPEV